MSTIRAYFTATVLANGTVLVAGGNDGVNNLNSAELYNPSRGNWTITGNMTQPRRGHIASILKNGTVLVAGGFDSSGNFFTTTELYNPSTGI